jgi:hypothetical protein
MPASGLRALEPPVHPASAYTAAGDLWIVTTYFNSAGYATRRANYDAFSGRIAASGLRLLTVECAFGDAPFELPASPEVLRVRARDVMWQKERLLNLAIAGLPASCGKVAWLDCDVLFENPEWASETSRLLETVAAVQPFDVAIELPRGTPSYHGDGKATPGFAAMREADPDATRARTYPFHGHTGFAWAARREALGAWGLYDALVVGGADHMIAHAMSGDWGSPCLGQHYGRAHSEHCLRWARHFHQGLREGIAHVPGALLHLWHGDFADRDYVGRHERLSSFRFDPESDLRIAESGCWEWASHKPAMHAAVAEYFARRNEDGQAAGGQ